jgi:hypothetical protein
MTKCCISGIVETMFIWRILQNYMLDCPIVGLIEYFGADGNER